MKLSDRQSSILVAALLGQIEYDFTLRCLAAGDTRIDLEEITELIGLGVLRRSQYGRFSLHSYTKNVYTAGPRISEIE
jgi:hypothetical protein